MNFEAGYTKKAIKSRMSYFSQALAAGDADDIAFNRNNLEFAVAEASISVPQSVLDEAKSLLQSI